MKRNTNSGKHLIQHINDLNTQIKESMLTSLPCSHCSTPITPLSQHKMERY
jgi:hypothetical protein